MSFEVTGVHEAEAKLKHVADGLADLPMADVAKEGVSIAKRLAPKDTGRLAASIRPATRAGYASVQIGVPYARFVIAPQWKKRVDDLMNARSDVETQINKLVH